MTPSLDLASVALFLTVLELGSVSKAARRHDLSQPSATARLARLESELGVALLERAPTGTVPTPAGQSLARDARRLLDAADDVVETSRQLRTDAAASVRIGSVAGLAPEPLGGWIRSWEWPRSVTVDLVVDHAAGIADAVRRGEVDLGLVDGPAEPIGLRSASIATDRVVAVVGPRHRWHGLARPVGVAHLLAERLVVTERGVGTGDVVDHVLGSRLDDTDVRTVRGIDDVLLAASTSDEIGFAPARCLVEPLEALDLDVTLWQPIRLVWRGRRPERNAARALVDHLRFGPSRSLDRT